MNISVETELSNLLYNIKYLRVKNEMSKKEMAGIMGIGIAALDRIEEGQATKKLGGRAVLGLSEHFNVLPSVLIEKHLDT